MIFFYLFRKRIFHRLDREKLRFALGWTGDSLFLSHRYPLYRQFSIVRLIFSRAYAAAVATWLGYRLDLFDGRRG